MIKVLCAFMCCLMLLPIAYANDMDVTLQEGLHTGTTNQKQANDALKAFNPDQTFQNYDSQPPESDYFKGGTQTHTTLKEDAAAEAPKTDTGATILTSFNTRPQYTIDPKSPEMQKSQLVQDNATDIVNGVSNEFVNCTKQQTCTTTYENKLCEESPASINQYCKKTLNIDMVPKETKTHYYLFVHLSASDHDYAGLVVNAVTGKVGFKGPSEAHYSLSGQISSSVPCQSLQGTYKITAESHSTKIDYINLPTCSNGLNIDFHISGHDKASIDIKIDMVSTITKLEPHDRWENNCIGLSNNTSCTLQSERCLEANTTHTISEVSVTRSCWEYEDNYLCRGNTTNNACQPLRDQGCEQINSTCTNKTDGGCLLYSQEFRCPIKNCMDNSVICNGETYCLTDDCLTHTKIADPDFQKAVSALSAVKAAGDGFDSQSTFTGTPKSCVSDIVGFANCCKEDGWGIDINLANCTEEEKELGKAKEEKQTIYIGSYCDKNPLGICITHRKAYCVFPSILDRIVQQQGRGDQLHIPFGSSEHPDCRGITPDELQKINFDLIDFSDFYTDIAKNTTVEDQASINQRMQKDMEEMTGGAA